MKRLTAVMLIILLLVVAGSGCIDDEKDSLTVFCGSASKPAMEEAAKAFTEKTGINILLNFGGSGTVLSQMKLDRSGDLYIPGSPDYMTKAEREEVVDPDTVKIVSYLVPAILVPQGNPENIRGLDDLARPGLEIGVGNPDSVCVGLYAYEILDYNNMMEQVVPNIVTQAESCSKTASLVALKSVDAIIGWRVFSEWHEAVDAVLIEPDQIPRIAYIPAAVSNYSHNKENAGKFLDFLVSAEGQESFRKWGYIATEDEARQYAPKAAIGGEYTLPETYRTLAGKQ